jgi:hypothetical protein
MTALLGGSVLLIAASAAALVYGWLNAEDTFIWGSIAATAGAAVLVVVAYLRSSKEPVVTASAGPGGEAGPAPLAHTPPESGPSEAPTQVQAPAPGAPAPSPAAPPSEAATAAMPAVAPEDVGDDDAGTSADGPATQQVVGIPKTKKFHKPTCRFASAEGAEPMTRADAESRSFGPCGVCKP